MSDIRCMCSPGEYFDKLTILINKVYNCTDRWDVLDAVVALGQLFDGFPSVSKEEFNEIATGLKELRDINQKLWIYEEDVRKIVNPTERLAMSDTIRELNAQRSEIKNVITEHLGGLREVKDYDTGHAKVSKP